MRIRRHPAALFGPPAVALIVGLASCGDGDEPAGPDAGRAQLPVPINLADCTDWNAGTVEERLGTVREVREFLRRPVPGAGGSGRVLDDEQAYEMFERQCAEEAARGYKLYKLYARAAAFLGE